MVLAATAKGLSPQIETTVLTRGFQDSAAREEYDCLTVHRFWNPAPEGWKDYATGARSISFLQKCYVTGLDVFCSLGPLRTLMPEVDLIHLHFPLPLGLSVLAVRAFVNRPLVVTVHGNADVYELPPAMAPLTRAVLKRADAVVSVSHDLARHMERTMGLKDVTVIPNGIDVDDFQLATNPGGTLTLVSICRLVPRKNVHVLIAAVERLAKEGAKVSLVIAGTGPEEERIARLARGCPRSVRFLGFIDEAQKRTLLSEADVFVQLSMREGLSIAALEALASGVPCVVSDIPGVREPITPGQTGWYVDDPEDVRSVVETLRRVMDQRSKLADMGRICRAVAVERYSLERMCQSYWTVFTDLLKKRD
jgi:glycosyltransferase involved in cell wall biosynthesis